MGRGGERDGGGGHALGGGGGEWRGEGAWVRVEAVCKPGSDIVFICGEQLQQYSCALVVEAGKGGGGGRYGRGKQLEELRYANSEFTRIY